MLSLELNFYGEPLRSTKQQSLPERLYRKVFQPLWAHVSVEAVGVVVDPNRKLGPQIQLEQYAFKSRRPEYSVVFQLSDKGPYERFAWLIGNWRFNLLTGNTCASFCAKALASLGGPSYHVLTPDQLWRKIHDDFILIPLESSKTRACLTFLATRPDSPTD